MYSAPVKFSQCRAAEAADAVPKESVLGGEPEARSATELQAHDSREHSVHRADQSPMADAMETRDARARELRNSQLVQKP